MRLEVVKANRDAILTIEDESSLPNFSGYRLERKIMGGEWEAWNGTGWGGAGILFQYVKVLDPSLSNGLYQYRYRIEFSSGPPTEYLYSDWLSVGYEKVGWFFGNYVPPTGRFGEILTADDIRYSYLWGIDLKASNGDEFVDTQIQQKVRSSAEELGRALKIQIYPVFIKSDPPSNLAKGKDYDIEEAPYSYRPEKWGVGGVLILRRRPVITVDRMDFYTPTGQWMMDLLPYARVDKTKGMIKLSLPKSGATGMFGGVAYGMLFPGVGLGRHYPCAIKIDYRAGYAHAGEIPEDMRDIIGKIAACKLLNVIGDGLIAGFSSSSLSLDGVSESFSSTQSATSAYFGARIKVYLDDIEDYLRRNARKFSNAVIGSI